MFDLVSPSAPAGDQPQAIAKLTEGLRSGAKHQVLLGVTCSGKTFTAANVIAHIMTFGARGAQISFWQSYFRLEAPLFPSQRDAMFIGTPSP